MLPTLFAITGPPGAGKTTLCLALARRLSPCLHLPVDDLRGWVVSGMADSVPWTEETERQFQVAESAACAVARTYLEAGFHVLMDHCRNLPWWDVFLLRELPETPVRRVCLLPNLDENLARNAARTDKAFDPAILAETIRFTHARFTQDRSAGWLCLDSGAADPDALADRVLGMSG